jgi:acetyltransferase-like isoleucine patch superfamily enzyme
MSDTTEPSHPRDYALPVRLHIALSRARSWFRVKWNRYRFLRLGKDFSCGDGLFVMPKHVSVGDHVYIGRHSHLACRVTIGDYCLIASYVTFVGGDHPLDVLGYPMRYSGGPHFKQIVIEDDVWIGHGAIILHGVRIGEGSVVAAGAVVTQNVAPYTIVAGNPARRVRDRYDDDQIERHKRALAENGFQRG